MAETSFNFLILFTLLVFFSNNVVDSAKSDGFSNILSPAKLGLKKEKLSHLHFYFHDITGGNNPTAIRVASAPMTNKSQTFFGAVVMTDDPLTAEPDVNSKLVGKAQGLYASASQEELAFLMVMNFVFVEGKYNGSSIALLGRNTVMTVREMSIVGGSGLFRFARGYARAKTHGGDPKTGDTIVEYNVYVFHY